MSGYAMKNIMKKTKRDRSGTPWTEQFRRSVLAGVGACVLAQEEVEELVDGLVRKGEDAEKDGRRLVLEVFANRGRAVRDGLAAAESMMQSLVERAVRRANLVTRCDVEQMNRRIDELCTELDRLESAERK